MAAPSPSSPPAEPAGTSTTARAIQQDYLEVFGYTDWDKYESGDFFLIKQKIAFALFGSPSIEAEDLSQSNANSNFGYKPEQIEKVLPIYEKICQFKKYSADHKSIFMSVIFVCCVPKNKNVTDNHEYDNLESDKICVSPVFRVRKCIKVDLSDCRTGCCIYIDDVGRIYKSWSLYLKNNKLPKGIIVAPEGGHYHGIICDDAVHVSLEVELSPASTVLATVRNVGDMVSTGVAVGAVGVLGFSLFAPLAAGVAVATGVASVVTGVYGTVVSSSHLVDRVQHDQTVGLQDAEARGCWLNLGASTTGMVAGASSKALATAASSGAAIGNGFRVAHDTAVVMAALTSGAGLANSITTCVIRYNQTKEPPSTLEIFQIASSILFLTNSLMSNRMASTIIEETQTSQITSYRDSLRSNRHRKIYDKLVAETRRVNGQNAGNAEIIRGILRIDNKDQFFQDTLRLNKQFNEHKVRISFKDGKALLNGEHLISPQEFYSLNPGDRSAYLSNIGPANLSSRNVPTNLGQDVAVPSNFQVPVVSTLMFIGKLVDSFPDLATSSNEDIVKFIALKIATFANNLNIYERFVRILRALEENLSLYMREQLACMGLYGNDILYKLFNFVYEYLKSMCGSDVGIPSVIDNFFVNGEFNEENFAALLLYFVNRLDIDYRTEVRQQDETRCKICNGITFSKD